MKILITISAILLLNFLSTAQLYIVTVPSSFGGDNTIRTYDPSGNMTVISTANQNAFEAMGTLTQHLNSIIEEGYKIIHVQDYNYLYEATSSTIKPVQNSAFPVEKTVYYLAVP